MFWGVEVSIDNSKVTIIKKHGFFNNLLLDKYITHKEIRFITGYNNINKYITTLYNLKRNKGYRSLSDLSIPLDTPLEELTKILDDKLVIDKFDKNDLSKPMKAKPFKTGVMSYPAIVQPKINGVRCTVRAFITSGGLFEDKIEIKLISKEGIEYNVPHVIKNFEQIYKKISHDVVFDGELYIHGVPAPTISGASKNINNSQNKKLKFIIFDLCDPMLDQQERLDYIHLLVKDSPLYHIEVLKQFIVNSDEEALNYADEFIEEGYEGTILRDSTSPYYFGGRRNNMLKIKKYFISEFVVLDVEAWEKDKTKALFVLQNDINNETFKCTPKGTNFERESMLLTKGKYIGTKVKVKFYERTKNGIPFHANVL